MATHDILSKLPELIQQMQMKIQKKEAIDTDSDMKLRLLNKIRVNLEDLKTAKRKK